MATPLTGIVTNLIDQYTVAINIGKDNGVTKGMEFDILGKTIKIKDPVNHEELGTVDFIKAQVEVTLVYDKFCLAKSYEYRTESTLPFPTFYTRRKMTRKLPIKQPEIEEEHKKIKVGDIVKQRLTKEEENE